MGVYFLIVWIMHYLISWLLSSLSTPKRNSPYINLASVQKGLILPGTWFPGKLIQSSGTMCVLPRHHVTESSLRCSPPIHPSGSCLAPSCLPRKEQAWSQLVHHSSSNSRNRALDRDAGLRPQFILPALICTLPWGRHLPTTHHALPGKESLIPTWVLPNPFSKRIIKFFFLSMTFHQL